MNKKKSQNEQLTQVFYVYEYVLCPFIAFIT